MYAKPLHLLQGMRRAQQGKALVCVSHTRSLNEGLQILDQHFAVSGPRPDEHPGCHKYPLYIHDSLLRDKQQFRVTNLGRTWRSICSCPCLAASFASAHMHQERHASFIAEWCLVIVGSALALSSQLTHLTEYPLCKDSGHPMMSLDTAYQAFISGPMLGSQHGPSSVL